MFWRGMRCGSTVAAVSTWVMFTRMEAIDPAFNLGTAMAISAAAASPNMGAITVRPLTFLLALLNIRLNYWLPNPAWAWQESWLHRTRYTRLGLGYLLAALLILLSQFRRGEPLAHTSAAALWVTAARPEATRATLNCCRRTGKMNRLSPSMSCGECVKLYLRLH